MGFHRRRQARPWNPLLFFYLLLLREAKGTATVLAGGLFHLQQPLWRREVAETIGFLPAGGAVSSLDPSQSRFSFLVATARRRRQRRRGISPSGFFLTPSMLRSGSDSESTEEGLRLWSHGTGARSRRLVV